MCAAIILHFINRLVNLSLVKSFGNALISAQKHQVDESEIKISNPR